MAGVVAGANVAFQWMPHVPGAVEAIVSQLYVALFLQRTSKCQHEEGVQEHRPEVYLSAGVGEARSLLAISGRRP